MIAGAKIVRNDHLLITHATQILKELELAVPSTDVSSWFKQINVYLRDLGKIQMPFCLPAHWADAVCSGSVHSRKVHGSRLRNASLVQEADQKSATCPSQESIEL